LNLEKRQFSAPQLKKIIAVSAEVKRDILANYPVPEGKIVVLYNGVDGERFRLRRCDGTRRMIRERWQIPSDAPLVLFVGSGFRRKGLERLISAWKSPGLAHVYLLIVGSDARAARYKARVERIYDDRIIFAGRQEEVENYYAAADVVALPALQEAFGNVVLESLASGVPVLVSRSVGAAEVLSGPLTAGIVDHSEDPNELAVKLIALLERARDPRCAEEARKVACRYSWHNHFKNLESLLIEIAKPHAKTNLV
jgi:UDP-glucose:(heptosyl)LPS alpha-1,3-glucosyltransferase